MSLIVQDYSYIPYQSNARLAWEFLRRNLAYRADWLATANLKMRQDDQLRSERVKTNKKFDAALGATPEEWGLFSLTNPDLDCRSASVFWTLAALPTVIPISLIAAPAKMRSVAFTPSLDAFHPASLNLAGLGQYLIFKGEGNDHRIMIGNHNQTLPRSVFSFHVLSDTDVDIQLSAIRSFHLFLLDRISDAPLNTTAAGLQKMRELQALDGYLAGASYREIAISIYGAAVVLQDWESGHLKDQVRYAVREGKRLMNGGYRDLLKK
jgi:hypothetical protein